MCECPYCGFEVEIHHPRNPFHCETSVYQHECDTCGKVFEYGIDSKFRYVANKIRITNQREAQYD